MICASCQREITEQSNFCYFCGARQVTATAAGAAGQSGAVKRLFRSSTNRAIGGVCAGFAEYLRLDITLARVLWILAVIFTGILPGVLAYVVAWILMPEAPPPAGAASAVTTKRLMRSQTDRKVAGVCGGLGEFLAVDATVVRLLWLLLSIVPGAIVGGIIAYFVAWIMIPLRPAAVPTRPENQTSPAAQQG